MPRRSSPRSELLEIVLAYILLPLLDGELPEHWFGVVKSGIHVHLASAVFPRKLRRPANGVFGSPIVHDQLQSGGTDIAAAGAFIKEQAFGHSVGIEVGNKQRLLQ